MLGPFASVVPLLRYNRQEISVEISVLYPYAVTALASFGGAWLAAHFALNTFYRQKIWERKTIAYTAIFEALHFIEQWYNKHLDAYLTQHELTQEATDKLRSAANDAEADLERRLASETWLIPNNCRMRLNKLTSDLKVRTEDWFEYLETGQHTLAVATDELRDMVHADLHLYSRPRLAASRYPRRFQTWRTKKPVNAWPTK
jgi:hypothetical protein